MADIRGGQGAPILPTISDFQSYDTDLLKAFHFCSKLIDLVEYRLEYQFVLFSIKINDETIYILCCRTGMAPAGRLGPPKNAASPQSAPKGPCNIVIKSANFFRNLFRQYYGHCLQRFLNIAHRRHFDSSSSPAIIFWRHHCCRRALSEVLEGTTSYIFLGASPQFSLAPFGCFHGYSDDMRLGSSLKMSKMSATVTGCFILLIISTS